jgi:hypothetical protein
MNKTEKIVLDESTVNALLAINTKNRNNSPIRTKRFAEAMTNGSWAWNSPQASLFVVNESRNWLLDGQTRLHAVKQSGMFGQMATLCIVPDEEAEAVFRTLDTGRARSPGQTLSALGVKNATTYASIAATLLANGSGSGKVETAIPTSEKNDWVFDKLEILELLPTNKIHVPTRKKFHSPIYAGALNAVRLGVISLDAVCDFLSLALKDAGAEKSPEKQLSRFFTQAVGSVGGKREAIEFAYTTKCAVAYANCRKVSTTKCNDEDIAFARSGKKSAWEL